MMNPNQQRFRRGPSNSPKSPNVSGAASEAERYSDPIYLDEEALQRMLDSFGPAEYTQFAVPQHPFNRFESTRTSFLGDQSGVWQAEDWPQAQNLPGEPKRRSKSPVAGTSPGVGYALPNAYEEEEAAAKDSTAQDRKESLLEWFDRSVEKELKKRREPSKSPGVLDPAISPLKTKYSPSPSKATAEKLAEVTASRIEIAAQLENEFTTELTDAVEKLAKAETMCSYAQALHAAEEAAQNAPPHLLEQAAAAGARKYTDIEASELKRTMGGGARPIEVVGYVGITRPRYPKQSK